VAWMMNQYQETTGLMAARSWGVKSRMKYLLSGREPTPTPEESLGMDVDHKALVKEILLEFSRKQSQQNIYAIVSLTLQRHQSYVDAIEAKDTSLKNEIEDLKDEQVDEIRHAH
jgi:hypothetical protein